MGFLVFMIILNSVGLFRGMSLVGSFPSFHLFQSRHPLLPCVPTFFDSWALV